MLYFRLDMNEIIATGHAMRCLSIADAARGMGEEVTFILADTHAVELIETRGHRAIVLQTDWRDMESELDAIAKVIEAEKIKTILVDSYQVTPEYLKSLRKMVKVAYLDDLNAFPYDVDMLICYANYYKKFAYEERYQDIKLCLGMTYAPLRSVFSNCDRKQIARKADKLLLLSGGADALDILDRLLETIPKSDYERIDVICGVYYPKYELICDKYKKYPNVCIHRAVSDIEKYMKDADMAVSAGGSTLYELCAMGTPVISYAFVDNQLDNVIRFAQDNVIEYAGDARTEDVIANINRLLLKYREDKALREEKSQRMQCLVDGKGAIRLVEALKGL